MTSGSYEGARDERSQLHSKQLLSLETLHSAAATCLASAVSDYASLMTAT